MLGTRVLKSAIALVLLGLLSHAVMGDPRSMRLDLVKLVSKGDPILMLFLERIKLGIVLFRKKRQ